MRTSTDRPVVRTRSRVTNGQRLLENTDGRLPIARRYKDLTLEVIGDLGGPDMTSEGQRQLARRVAAISVACEALESRLCNTGTLADEDGSISNYVSLVNVLNRSLSNLGLKRRMRDVQQPNGVRAALEIDQ